MMKNIIVCVLGFFALSMYGCSSDDSQNAASQEPEVKVSQAETMEQIWASQLDTEEKVRRVQEMLEVSAKAN